ncbi:MAG: glycosyltransferase [Mucilaginibacter sp.]|nr:glycosyltransferase [Mucilaginibacter sp.]
MITVTRNAQKSLGRCINSVIEQNYNNIEYIIVDGTSTDDTLQIIRQNSQYITSFISEPDHGIYDAINKGISLATGDIIGILNSDDFFAYNDVMSDVAAAFEDPNVDIIYGDLDYIAPNGRIVRKWRSGAYIQGIFNKGWMPPHPTFYCRRELFERLGYYDLQYGTAADYELMLRFMHANKTNAYYLNKVMVKMMTGGVSNKNYLNRIKAWVFDFKAMRKNGVTFPLMCIIFKPLRKIFQYI